MGRWSRGAALGAIFAGLLLTGCGVTKGTPTVRSPDAHPSRAAVASTISGSWLAFSGGRAVAVGRPSSLSVPYRPWTVQTRAAGILKSGSSVYVALNAWGLISFSDPTGPEVHPTSFRYYEQPSLFDERTINGFFGGASQLTLDLYHNTVFDAPAPASAPVTYVQFDEATTGFMPVALSPSREGWEPIEVVRGSKGGWTFAWKKLDHENVSFQYSLYEPGSGKVRSIDRSRFLASYAFQDVARAPAGIRAIAQAARGNAAEADRVVHLLVRDPSSSRIDRYRSGSESRLESGDASLTTIPVIRTDSALFALLPGGRIVAEPSSGSRPGAEPKMIRLPSLPIGYAYTDLWTDGRFLIVSWEQQRFTDVGAAGLFIAMLS